jgi:hypothetical protein
MTFDQIMKEIANAESVDLVGGVSLVEIRLAQEQLGLRFPPQYIEFLSKLGCGGVGSEEFIGLGGHQRINVVEATLWLRGKSGYPPFSDKLIPIRFDGFGNYDCIDTSRPTQDGECMVCFWSHESRDVVEDIAPTYFSWVMDVLELAKN